MKIKELYKISNIEFIVLRKNEILGLSSIINKQTKFLLVVENSFEQNIIIIKVLLIQKFNIKEKNRN
jgi:hypothetical protein